MRITAGLLILCEGKVLLVKQKRTNQYSIPKGEVRKGESHINAAIRETEEECGLVIKKEDIYGAEFLCSIDTERCRRKLFYYKAKISPDILSEIRTNDASEIEEIIVCGIEEAISIIQTSQVAILWDGGRFINPRILLRMVSEGWVHVTKHPTEKLYIYDYTEKCKTEKAWNELTLWCRGLIVDEKGVIVSYPLKKFFEYNQLFIECRLFNERFEVSEKIDGFLGLTYFIGGNPYIATRDSFISLPAIKATMLLYTKYPDSVSQMNENYTYIFEIVYPNSVLVLNYGSLEELFLIDIIDNISGKSVINGVSTLSFQMIPHEPNKHNLDYYLKQNRRMHEGLVLKFPDGNRLKVKYPWFRNEYIKKNG